MRLEKWREPRPTCDCAAAELRHELRQAPVLDQGMCSGVYGGPELRKECSAAPKMKGRLTPESLLSRGRLRGLRQALQPARTDSTGTVTSVAGESGDFEVPHSTCIRAGASGTVTATSQD
jgi:hypothetical protein